MITLHGEEVKLGDKVWDILYGWGEVTGLKDSMKNVYPIGVQFEGARRWYTEDGKLHAHKENPTLFWQPVEFEFPKKPKQIKKEKAWQWIYFDTKTEKYRITNSRYSSVDAVYSKHDRDRYKAIAPLQLSEKEREAKE